MKIKIELEGLTLDQATDLTKFLSSLKEPSEEVLHKVVFNREAIPAEYPKEVRRPYTLDKKIVNSIEEEDDYLSTDKEEKPKATRKKAEKVEAPAEAMTEHVEAVAETLKAIEVKDAETVSAPTLMQIRSLVASKAADNKEAIKAKLVELGAQNVSTLDAKHFQTIFDFLTEL